MKVINTIYFFIKSIVKNIDIERIHKLINKSSQNKSFLVRFRMKKVIDN